MQQKYFDPLKERFSTTPFLALHDLRNQFEMQINASDSVMGVVLMQHGKPICYHYETLNGVVVNYPSYDKELYALVQICCVWSLIILCIQRYRRIGP